MAARIVKKTLAGGRGPLPENNKDDKAIFDYEVLLPLVDVDKEGFPVDKDLYKSIDSTKKQWPDGYGKPLELVFGKKFQFPIMETCLMSMLVDEVAQFDIGVQDALPYPMVSAKLRDISKAELNPHSHEEHHHHHCAAMGPIKTGYDVLDELIAKPKPLRLVIHLKQVIASKDYSVDSWQLSDADRLKSVESLRLVGNDLFKAGNSDSAKEKYREALTLLDGLILKEKPGDDEWIELDNKNIPLYLNLAQCYLNLHQFYEAAGAAEEVLKRDPFNEKGLFRRAKARIGTWELEKAEQDLVLLREKHPNSATLVTTELAVIAAKKTEKEKEDRHVYKAMLGAHKKYARMWLYCSCLFVIPLALAAPPLTRIDIARPDHLDAVPLERDGGLNRDFRREVVLGGDSATASKEVKSLDDQIRQVFATADKDQDGRVSRDELKAQIVENTNKHLVEGRKEAEQSFQEVDTNGDGKVSWPEYYRRFVVEKKLVEPEHAQEHDEHSFDASTRRLVAEEKNNFEAADADNDGLDSIEWLGFQHPEHSRVMLRQMAEDIMQGYDDDRDGVLSRAEFAKEPPGESLNPAMDAEYKRQREAEFDEQIDVNKDGQATLAELLDYVNPKNDRHATQEVTGIMDIVDVDRDDFLTLKEMLANAPVLASSGFIHVKKALHDDL